MIHTKGGSMNLSEEILAQISQFIFTEITGIKNVKHDNKQSFTVVTDSGKELVVEIKEDEWSD